MVDFYDPNRRPLTPLTDDEWLIDGVSLNTLAFNITRLDGSREGPPTVRGENLLIPLRPGRIWAEKFPEERTITLGMWVIGADPRTGLVPTGTTDSLRRQFLGNYQHLTDLLYKPHREMTLTKKWIDPVTGAAKSASARVTYGGGLEGMEHVGGPGRGIFVVDLIAAEPYFYDDVETTATFDSLGLTSFPHTCASRDVNRKLTVTMQAVGGTVGAQTIGQRYPDLAAESYGPLYAMVSNTVPDPEVYFGLNNALASGQKISFDVFEFTAVKTAGPGELLNWVGFVRNAGTRHWLLLLPGSNTIQLRHGGGGGTLRVTLTYRNLHF